MRDLLLGLGLACLAIFGSALDSQGWAGWAAMAGLIGGLALMVIGGNSGEDHLQM